MGIEGMGMAARINGAEQEGRRSTGIQGLLLHQHRSLGAQGCAPIMPTRSPRLQNVVNEALGLNAGGKGPC